MRNRYSKILVTGGAGFIGSHIVDRLIKDGFQVAVIDNLHTGNMENLEEHIGNKNFQFIKGDIRDVDLLQSALKDIDAVFHEAAQTNVQLSLENPLLTNDVNVNGTLNLLKTCLEFSVKRLIYASSAAIYGDTNDLPIKEQTKNAPTSPYGVSKLASEKYIEVFHNIFDLETVCLRYFNVYGPRQANNEYSGVITKFTKQLVEGNPPTIYGDGDQIRDFVNIKDIVDANMLSLYKKNAVGEIFNIAFGQPITINYLSKTLQQILGREELEPIHLNPKPGDIRYSYADINKAKTTLNYNPKVKLFEGLSEFIEHLTS